MGRIVVTVLGMVAEMERKFILERQRAGIEAAKAAGVYAGKGRPKSVPVEEIRQRHAAGEGPTAIARTLGVSRRSIYRAIQANDPRQVFTLDTMPDDVRDGLLQAAVAYEREHSSGN